MTHISKSVSYVLTIQPFSCHGEVCGSGPFGPGQVARPQSWAALNFQLKFPKFQKFQKFQKFKLRPEKCLGFFRQSHIIPYFQRFQSQILMDVPMFEAFLAHPHFGHRKKKRPPCRRWSLTRRPAGGDSFSMSEPKAQGR